MAKENQMNDVELPAREHLDGCPAERIETFSATRPSGEKLVVVRCISCGGQAIYSAPADNDEEASDAG
jgi:hypothetical protein